MLSHGHCGEVPQEVPDATQRLLLGCGYRLPPGESSPVGREPTTLRRTNNPRLTDESPGSFGALVSIDPRRGCSEADTAKEAQAWTPIDGLRWLPGCFSSSFVTSIAALALFQPVLDDPVGYVAGSGSDNRIFFGAFLELLLIIANIGTAVVLFPAGPLAHLQGIQAVTGPLAPASSPVRRPGYRSLVRLRWVLGITGRVQRSTDPADIGPAQLEQPESLERKSRG
jgi:hypothetical protein